MTQIWNGSEFVDEPAAGSLAPDYGGGVGDRIYLTPKTGTLSIPELSTRNLRWELYDGYPTVGDSIYLDESGSVTLAEAGIYAAQISLNVDGSSIDYARWMYDDSNWGGLMGMPLQLSGPPGDGLQRSADGSVTAWCNASVNFNALISTAAAANLLQGSSWMHVVRIA